MQAFRRYIRPSDADDPESIKHLIYVLEDKDTRLKMAKVLRDANLVEPLEPKQNGEMRAAAWAGMVKIVEQSFPQLMEEDKKRRAEAAKEPKPEPAQLLKKPKQEIPKGEATVIPSRQAKTESNRWMWLLLVSVTILCALGLSLRDRITKVMASNLRRDGR
ncbi:hypothetical protein [Haloferula luteola]|uniref:hypothetical protein n=1 Tax=Haloferula luteola TaxID=595692 RepID=UPI001C84AA73|nr:hypothetical protein [Haloferula luteola]